MCFLDAGLVPQALIFHCRENWRMMLDPGLPSYHEEYCCKSNSHPGFCAGILSPKAWHMRNNALLIFSPMTMHRIGKVITDLNILF